MESQHPKADNAHKSTPEKAPRLVQNRAGHRAKNGCWGNLTIHASHIFQWVTRLTFDHIAGSGYTKAETRGLEGFFMDDQRVRISDIAQELGLSTATVSNVIHGKTKKISDETVKRVLELLDERQYMPNRAEILLGQNPSRIIGIFVNDHRKYEGHTLEDFFIASSLNHLSDEIEACGRFMMVKKNLLHVEVTL